MQTIFVRPGARRPYVPYGYLKDARDERDRLRSDIAAILTAPGITNADAVKQIAQLVARDAA